MIRYQAPSRYFLLLLIFLVVPFLTTILHPSTASALAHVGIVFQGDVLGSVTSSDGLINCPGTCDATWPGTTQVTLTATTVSGHSVVWTGAACDNGNESQTCTLTIQDGDYPGETVSWILNTHQAKLVFEGSGSGTVTSSRGGLNCSSSCTAGLFDNTPGSVVLTATPASGSVFGGWDLPSSGADDCYLTIGKGGQPTGINPSTTCYAANFDTLSNILFTAAPIFNKAVTTSSSSTSKTTTKATSSTPATTTSQTPPAPTMEGLKVSGATDMVKVDADTGSTVTLPLDKPLVLSGKTIPNGIITLTIHSTPRTATVAADAGGNWTYTVTGLEAGQHHVDATVTDPVTKQVSPSVTLAAFTLASKVTSSKGATAAPTHTKKSSMMPLLLSAVAIVVLIAGAAFWWFKLRHHRETSSQMM